LGPRSIQVYLIHGVRTGGRPARRPPTPCWPPVPASAMVGRCAMPVRSAARSRSKP
jgi:hypothetical protein